MQEVRSKLANCQNQQAEMLRRAQDICLSAEDRAEKADTRLEKIQAQVNRLETELRDSRAEAKRLTTDLRVTPSIVADSPWDNFLLHDDLCSGEPCFSIEYTD